MAAPPHARTPAPSYPRYQEAYPRLNMIKLERAIDRGQTVCVFNDESVRRVGHVEVVDVRGDPPSHMITRFQLLPMMEYQTRWEGEGVLGIRRCPNAFTGVRYLFGCPLCRGAKAILIFAQSRLACAKCHKLLHRSQVVDFRTLLRERRDELREQLCKGRPKGMQHRTYERLHAELERLEKAVPGIFPLPCREHQHLVTGQWMSLEADEEEQRWLGDKWWVPEWER